MRLAFFGGSFNPVHIGHLALAEQVRVQFGYDRILLVPVNVPPHKELASGANSAQRLEMLRISTEGNAALAVDDCEIRRGGVSYTWQTVEHLSRKYADSMEGKVAFIMGYDQAAEFSTWNRPDYIAENSDLLVARRPDPASSGIPSELRFPYPHRVIQNRPIDLSSSEIRGLIASGGAWRYLVAEGVYDYIIRHGLYGYC